MIARYSPNFGVLTLLAACAGSTQSGAAVAEAKDRLSKVLSSQHVLLTPSGRGALYLLLRALGETSPNGRVVMPAYTCSAVAEAARLAGREVVPLEHGAGGVNLTPADLRGSLRAGDIVIATHQYGYPCDIRGLVTEAANAGAIVLEDIAAAFGATIDGQAVGSFGLACFGSFDCSKLLHVPPKGGFAATNDHALSDRLIRQSALDLKPFALFEKFKVLLGGLMLALGTRPLFYRLFYGLNFALRGRFTAENGVLASQPNGFYSKEFAEWQAVILLRQLRQLPAILKRRAAILERYRRAIQDGAEFGVEHAHVEQPGAVIRFPIYVRGNKLEVHRALARKGIDTGFSFTSIVAPETATNAWSVARAVLNLPMSTSMTEQEQSCVIDAVHSLGKAR